MVAGRRGRNGEIVGRDDVRRTGSVGGRKKGNMMKRFGRAAECV